MYELLLPPSIVAVDLRPRADSRAVSTVWAVASGFGTAANAGKKKMFFKSNTCSGGTNDFFSVACVFVVPVVPVVPVHTLKQKD